MGDWKITSMNSYDDDRNFGWIKPEPERETTGREKEQNDNL